MAKSYLKILQISWKMGSGKEQGTKSVAAIAQLGERQTEDLKVPGSIPGRGMCKVHF